MMRTLLVFGEVVVASAALSYVFDPVEVGNVLLLGATAMSWTFALLYATKSRWRLLNAGRSLLYVMLSLSIVLTQNTASIFLGEYTFRGQIRVVMYLTLFCALVGMIRTLWRIQNTDREEAAKRFHKNVTDPDWEF